MRLAFALAVVLHAALLAALALIVVGDHITIDLKLPRRQVVTIEAPPIAVEFIETPGPAATGTVASAGPRSHHAHIASTSVSTGSEIGSTTTTTTTTTTTEPGPTSPYMKMRGAELGLSGDSAARIVGATPHELPDKVKESGKLQNAPGGKAIVFDRVTTMSVERDGNAHFDDKPDIDVKLKLPIPHIDLEGMRKDLGATLTEWFADPYAQTKYGRTQDLPNHIAAVPGGCDDWGSVWCDDPLAPKVERYAREQKSTGGSLLGGAADISAYLQRKYVGDPYASRKLKLLDDTRDERVARGAAFRDQQLVRSAELIDRNIARAAALTGRDRRIALFELWDECSEGEGTEAQAGQRARAQVIGWIRAHLPQGSDDAFTDDEIAELQAHRASHQRFEPY